MSGPDRWIAIVDDDESIRASLARLLRLHGIAARTFESGEEYLDGAINPAPAGILLDVHLRRGMSGVEFSESLRTAGDAPPIILITGADESELALAAGIGKCNGILRKPFDVGVLLDLVANRFGLEQAASVR